nr:hypothetical protein CFP56_67675 [Quercus suber]
MNIAVGTCIANKINTLLVDAPKSSLAWGPFLHHECQKTRKACLSAEDDYFQFGPGLRSVAPKFSHKKSNFSQSKPREEDDDGIHVSKDEEGKAKSSQIHRQLTAPPLVEKSNKMAVRVDDLGQAVHVGKSTVEYSLAFGTSSKEIL